MSNAHICTQAYVTIAPFGRLLALHNPSSTPAVDPNIKRGKIDTFSRQSRKRLFQLFASIDLEGIPWRTIFNTLTYPASYPSAPSIWHDDLRRYCQKVERRFPGCAIIWKLEFQIRGAPHYHLLIFNVGFFAKEEVTRLWGSIAHQEDQFLGLYATEVVGVESWSQAFSYVSKYLAKQFWLGLPSGSGRFWGVRRRGNLPLQTFDQDLTRREFERLKRLVWFHTPAGRVVDWVWKQPVGVWTMVDGAEALRWLDWARHGGEELYTYWTRATRRMPVDRHDTLRAIARNEKG